MELSQQIDIPLPRESVWTALNDPDVLKQCIPGCTAFETKGDNQFEVKVTTKIGPVKASFTGDVELTALNPPESYTIIGQGQGGVAGFAKGSATVELSPSETEGTRMTYSVTATVGGKLAQIGSRLVDGAAKKLAAEFFKRFNEIAGAAVEDNR
ncbi:MAG: carbon monoxide dehydrogenase subunit G [Pseudomonadota bacterium]